jgi:hypothetical protein
VILYDPPRSTRYMVFPVTLTMEPFMFMHGQFITESDPVVIYEVKGLDRSVFIDYRGGANRCEVWQIRGREEEYPSPSDALAVLQGEVNAGTLS